MTSPRYCRRCSRGPLAHKLDRTVPARMRHYGRGLDGTCYQHARTHGLLNNYPPIVDHDALAEDYQFLRDTGETDAERIATRLGVHPSTVRDWRRKDQAA